MEMRFTVYHSTRLDLLYNIVYLVFRFWVCHLIRQGPLNKYDKKYNSRPLKTFLQSQTSKFLNYFHDERKQRLANTLDNEQWKQVIIFQFRIRFFVFKIKCFRFQFLVQFKILSMNYLV